uniref:Uncharacterized protein n=1 Tax=Globisporangium ultimum (strain ATCC 200006 / CBS 805.95 / DAOM BR144) TaxID=431595 RepID=K3W695_GLOUD
MVKSSELTSLVGDDAKRKQQASRAATGAGRAIRDRVWCMRHVTCSWGLLAMVLWMVVVVLYLFHVPFVYPSTAVQNAGGATFRLSFASSAHAGPITGRLLLCIAKKHVVEDPFGDDQPRFLHCWTGSYDETLSMAWNTLNQRMVPQMVDHIVTSAPPDADLSFTMY